MVNRLRADFLTGICSITAGNPATLTTTTGINISIGSNQYLPIVLNPAPFDGIITNSEIVYTTGAYSPGTTNFTVNRAQEGTTSLGSQTNIPWISGPTVQDFGILNGMINGDFPIPTASGQVLGATASGIGTVVWIPPYGVTVSGSQVYGYLSHATISGSQVVGFSTLVSGYNVYGNLSNATISGSDIVGPIALVNGSTATTQSALNDSTDVSTTAYTDAAVLVETNRAVTEEITLSNAINSYANTTLTFTNKRITKRVYGPTSDVTSAILTDNYDVFYFTNVGGTGLIECWTASPNEGDEIDMSFTTSGGTHSISFSSAGGGSPGFESSGTVVLPTTISTTRLDLHFIFNSATSNFRLVYKA
jgi:hypothetical protein